MKTYEKKANITASGVRPMKSSAKKTSSSGTRPLGVGSNKGSVKTAPGLPVNRGSVKNAPGTPVKNTVKTAPGTPRKNTVKTAPGVPVKNSVKKAPGVPVKKGTVNNAPGIKPVTPSVQQGSVKKAPGVPVRTFNPAGEKFYATAKKVR